MPRHIIEGPDGQRHVIEAPEGATPQDVMAFFQQQRQPAPDAAPQGEMGWGEVGVNAVRNIPKSALNLGQNIAHAVAHPIDTASALYDVGKGGVSKAAGAIGIEQDPSRKAQNEAAFDAVTQFFADRYGGVENFKRTIAEDPVGFAADLSTVLTGGAFVGARAPGVAGNIAKTVGDIGRTIDPIMATGKAASAVGRKVVEPLVSYPVGLASGVGAEPIRTAARAGAEGNTAFLESMRGQASINESIDMAQSALGEMRKERSAAYQAGMQSVKADQTPLSYGPIRTAIADAKSGTHFNGVSISDAATKAIDDIEAKVEAFRASFTKTPGGPSPTYRTAEGLDALKRAVGEIRQGTQPGTVARNVADQVYNSVKSEIVKQVPEYAQTMKAYADASDRINDIQSTLSLKEKVSPDTTARKLTSVMRNNVNTNYGNRMRLVEELAKHEPDLPYSLAGHTLSSPTPRGLAGYAALGQAGLALTTFNPAFLAYLLASSPRLVGETAYVGGRASRKVKDVAKKTGVDSRRLAQALMGARVAGETEEGLRGGIGPRYDDFGNLR